MHIYNAQTIGEVGTGNAHANTAFRMCSHARRVTILALLLLWALLSLWPNYVGVVFWHYLCGCKVVYIDNHPSYFVRKRCSSEGCLSDLRLRRLASPVHLMQNTQSKLILTCTFANPQKLLKFKLTRIRAYTVLTMWHLWILFMYGKEKILLK